MPQTRPETGLQAAAQAAAALSPEQRKYRQLVEKIERARATLQCWIDEVPKFDGLYIERTRPLQAQMLDLRLKLVRKLDQLQAAPGCKRADRDTLRRALCELAASVADHELADDDTTAEMQVLHDRYAPSTLEEDRLAEAAAMKRMIEMVTGVDLGERSFESSEALAEHARQQLLKAEQDREEQRQQQGERGDGAKHKSGRKPKRMTALQHQQEAEAQAATASLREIYRRLVSALHPDRASDDVDRQRRTALMQRTNQAYEAQDLLGLFALQLEIEQVDAHHLANASSERMRHYNRVLTAQLQEITNELHGREQSFVLHYGLEPWGRVNPQKLGGILREAVSGMREVNEFLSAELRQLEAPQNLRRWLKQTRQQQSLDDDGFENVPF